MTEAPGVQEGGLHGAGGRTEGLHAPLGRRGSAARPLLTQNNGGGHAFPSSLSYTAAYSGYNARPAANPLSGVHTAAALKYDGFYKTSPRWPAQF